jgi:hypothetical protein
LVPNISPREIIDNSGKGYADGICRSSAVSQSWTNAMQAKALLADTGGRGCSAVFGNNTEGNLYTPGSCSGGFCQVFRGDQGLNKMFADGVFTARIKRLGGLDNLLGARVITGCTISGGRNSADCSGFTSLFGSLVVGDDNSYSTQGFWLVDDSGPISCSDNNKLYSIYCLMPGPAP